MINIQPVGKNLLVKTLPQPKEEEGLIVLVKTEKETPATKTMEIIAVGDEVNKTLYQPGMKIIVYYSAGLKCTEHCFIERKEEVSTTDGKKQDIDYFFIKEDIIYGIQRDVSEEEK